jgi:CheY-like chemotaxis protein
VARLCALGDRSYEVNDTDVGGSADARISTYEEVMRRALEREGKSKIGVHTILLVDDDVAVRRTMARFLGIEGFVVVEAGNGREALTHLQTGCSAAAILLDLRMPMMDGWAFRTLQRADRSIADIPVIILSGADAHRFHELDAVAAFEKPVTMSKVVAVLRDLLSSH